MPQPRSNRKRPLPTVDRRSRSAPAAGSSLRRRRAIALCALAAAAAATSLIAISPSGGSTNPSTTAPKPPPLPCPRSGHSVDTKAMTPPSSTPQGVSWAGVFERIYVKTSMTGAVSKTPRQHTFVAAAGQGTETANVPMSSKRLRHHILGRKPNVANGVAQVKLNLKRKTVVRLESDYERPLPVAVKVSYKLDGKPISSGDIKGKSGAVEVDYQVTNTTAKPVKVCFKGFNGKQVKRTVTEVAPIYAYLSLTLPKHVSQFSAPGGFLNADRHGVDPQWFFALFKPLGPTQQTLKLTMHTSRAKIPKATLLLELVQPEALTGSAPAKSAALVAKSQADAAAAAGKVQADVAALELKAGQPRKPRHSSRRGGSRRGRTSRASAPSLSFGTSTASLARMKSEIATLGQAESTFLNDVNRPARSLVASANGSINRLTARDGRSIDRLTASTSRSIDRLTAGTSRSIDGLTASTGRSLHRLAADLNRSLATPSLDAITAGAGRLQTMALYVGTLAGKLVPEVSALADKAQGLVSALPVPVANALRLYLLFGVLNRDLDALPPAEKTTAAFVKLKADVTAGQALAKSVSDAISQIQAKTQSVVGDVQTLQTDVMSLHTKLGALETAAVQNAENTTQARVNASVEGLDARFAADIARAQRDVAGAGRTAHRRLPGAQRTAHQSATAATRRAHKSVAASGDHAKQAFAAALRSARQKVTAAELKVAQIQTSVRAKAKAALASAKAKAKQGGQAALASVQASADKAEAAARSALSQANDAYAHLLAINQQAVAWALPGGNATGVTEQEGSLIYTISGS